VQLKPKGASTSLHTFVLAVVWEVVRCRPRTSAACKYFCSLSDNSKCYDDGRSGRSVVERRISGQRPGKSVIASRFEVYCMSECMLAGYILYLLYLLYHTVPILEPESGSQYSSVISQR
jgi:hypothetical protein